MEKRDKERNNFLFQDINLDEKSLKFNIYKFFYSLILEKKEFKAFLKIIEIFIETIQFISFAFSPIHYDSWKIERKTIKIISNVLNAFRLSEFIKSLKYNQYLAILYALVIIIFILNLIVILNILFIESSYQLYRYSSTIIRTIIDVISVLLYIPLTEIMLLLIKCDNGKVQEFKDGEKCWEKTYYLNFTISMIGIVLLFLWSNFMLNFSFYPFANSKSTIRIYSFNDIIILFLKLFLILQNLVIKNEYLSIAILFIISLIMFFCCYSHSTYNNNKIEIAIYIKNILVIWTFLVLLISKIFINISANGFIYLLVLICPIIIYFSILIYQEKFVNIIQISTNCRNINQFIQVTKYKINLIDSFLENNKIIGNKNEKDIQKNIILLKGIIKVHNLSCSDKDCPLTKFSNNEGNYNIQKQCLLNYMNIYFINGLKMYSNNIYILMQYINFNYSKRFNLNSVRGNLLQLKKIKCNLNERYIIYCMEQNIGNTKKNGIDLNFDNDQNNDSQIDLVEQKYQKLKYCIENSIKLYGEFWGIFSTNISSNINTSKLYSLGEKINIYLKEMNNIWDSELKNKRISNEYQGIVQLYSKFLLEVLWDQKKSKEIYKKLNDENINNYNQGENKKINEEMNNNINNIESLIDIEDYLILCNMEEKGNCKIVQITSSFSHFLGYQKIDIIGKNIEIILPNLLAEEIRNYFEYSIKLLHNGQTNQNDLFNENESNKNSKLILVKSRMGYIFPFFSSFIFSDDNDYSNSFLVKIKLENKELKSNYSYFIFTNYDYVIENISSSAINLGLSLDLLKKYLVKIGNLVRTEDDQNLITEKYKEYEEEQKVITWVFPDVIYPKDNLQQNKEEEMEYLIQKSKKKKYNMIMKLINLNENENKGFLFKLTEISKNNKKRINSDFYIPKSGNKLIMFYLNKLNYVRTYVVDKKSGFNNLQREEEQVKDNNKILENNKLDIKKSKKTKKSLQTSDDESSFDYNQNILTKEKILSLQVDNFIEIKNFIYSLPLYGLDVSLEKFRPNGDRYSASKITESLIKIQLNHFCKRIDERLKINHNEKKKRIRSINENAHMDSHNLSNNDNYLFSENSSSLPVSSGSNSSIQGEEINKGLSYDSSSAFANIFKANTLKYIRLLIMFAFLITFVLLLLEFMIVIMHINKLKKKITFFKNSCDILNYMLYTFHFVIEGIISNSLKDQYTPVIVDNNLNNHLNNIAKQLSNNRQQFTETYDLLITNDLGQEFTDYMNKQIEVYTLTLGIQEKFTILFNNAMNRISSAINTLSSNPLSMIMTNRDTYELIYNLINVYYYNWHEVTHILLDDSEEATKMKTPLLIIVISYLFFSIIILAIFLKLLAIFSIDREKPINLFLTLKKIVFENLKNSAENFSNKLLNKFFGNEENEEESQQVYQENIHPNDINIIKFKVANESSITKSFEFLTIIIIIFIFLIINIIYFIVKYIEFRKRMNNIEQFIYLYDYTDHAHGDFILSLNIFLSFFFDKSIPILNDNETTVEFLDNFFVMSDEFENSIFYTSITESFLSGEYLKKYRKYLLGNYEDLLDREFLKNYGQLLTNIIGHGIKPIVTRIFEAMRYFTVIFFQGKLDLENHLLFLKYGFTLYEINILTESLIRKWFDGVINLMINSFYDYMDQGKLSYIITSTVLLVFFILYYLIVWRIYEEKLKSLFKKSVDLINLIPQEIKILIIEKLNE